MAFGTIRKLQLDGTPFDVHTEADLTQNTQYETEYQATTGKNYPIKKKKVAMIEVPDVVCDGQAWVDLQALQARDDQYPISYTDGDGNTWTGPGGIQIESRTTQEGKAAITLFPETVFEAFIA